MRTYIIKRLLLTIPTLFCVTIVVFLSVRFIPASVVDLMVGDMAAASQSTTQTAIDAQAIEHALGLDVPVHIQYLRWLRAAIRGDLGKSLWTGQSITEEILNRLPVSLELMFFAIMTTLVIGVPIGTYSAARQDTWGDFVGRTIAILAISVPSFWLGIIVVVYPSVWWNWTPAADYYPLTKDLARNLLQFVIPGTIMGMVMSGMTMRMTRTMMLEVLRQDYIRTAWAKGLSERTVLMRHALKNALMPVVTIVGTQVAFLIGGSIVLEQIFCLPGIGRLLITALSRRDYPVISAINLVMASFVLVVNLVVDLTYAYLDPRIKY